MKKSNRYFTGLIAACAACLILAGSCSQSPPLENNVGFTAGRAGASAAAGLGMISAVIGGLALRTTGRVGTGSGRTGAIIALVLGLIVMVLSVVHLGNSTGGFGTGSGRAGAIVALVLGLIGMSLGGLAFVRSRRFRNID